MCLHLGTNEIGAYIGAYIEKKQVTSPSLFWENRQAHNLKVAGSNPAPATKKFHKINDLTLNPLSSDSGFFLFLSLITNSGAYIGAYIAVRFIPFFFVYILAL